MTAQVVIAKPNKLDWRRSKEYGELKWKLLVDSTITNTSDISVGILKVKPNHSLALHSHSPKELYIIKTGKGLLLKPEKNEIIKTLAYCSGHTGIAGGQELDLKFENKKKNYPDQ